MKRILFLFICIPFFLNAQNINDSLIAYYPFNGNANDESPNMNDGTVFGAVLTTDRFDNENSAYEFNGTSSYIQIQDSESLHSPTNELTQAVWIYPYTWSLVGQAGVGVVLMKSNSANNQFQYRLSLGPEHINTAINNYNNAVNIPTVINFNQWYFIVSVLKNDTVTVYVNGNFMGEGELSGPIQYNTLPLEIGRDVPGAIEVWHGKIDDIRIYNRAITEEEVAILYEGSFSVHDISGSHNDVIIYPVPATTRIIIKIPPQRAENSSMSISNTNGQQLITQHITKPQTEIDISHLPTGIYIVKVWNDKDVMVQKVIKQ